MRYKVKHYSTVRLVSELELAHSRLKGYLAARETMPASSVLGALSIAWGIKHEKSYIAALEDEIRGREAADPSC